MTLAPMRHIVSCTFNSITVFRSSLLTSPSQKTEFQNRKKNKAIGALLCLLHEVLCTQRKDFCTIGQCELWHGEIMSVWTILVKLWSHRTCPNKCTKSERILRLAEAAGKWRELCYRKKFQFFPLKNVLYDGDFSSHFYVFKLILLICKVGITIACI